MIRVRDMPRRQQKAVFANFGNPEAVRSRQRGIDRARVMEKEFPKPVSEKDAREKEAYSHAIMTTPQYKRLIRQGISRPEAVELASESIAVRRGIHWYSISRLPVNLQLKAKAYWKVH